MNDVQILWKRSMKYIYDHPTTIIDEISDDLQLDLIDYGILYGIHNIYLNKWYIGSTRNLYDRLWNSIRQYGHFQLFDAGDHFMDKLEDYDLCIIELISKELIGPDYWKLTDLESKYIELLDSYKNGYNKDPNGYGGVIGTTWINNGIEQSMVRFTDNYELPKGWKIGRLFGSGDYNSGKKYVTDGIHSKMIHGNEVSNWLKNNPEWWYGKATGKKLFRVYSVNKCEIYLDDWAGVYEDYRLRGKDFDLRIGNVDYDNINSEDSLNTPIITIKEIMSHFNE